ncbi:hypothetical protein [uncultured Sphingomonas sp.]|uniref:hypothetical protein n=1 Tax=uncultured Sphingomonas sp. TaxID=158754 RepID=UPI002618C61A|nr:hypothetical protein [uncultured Sphingomonas sp.]
MIAKTTDQGSRKRAPYTRTGGGRLPDETLAEIWRRHQAGQSGNAIARALGLNQGGVARRIIEMRECGGVPAPKVRKNARIEGTVYRNARATWHGEQPRVRFTAATEVSLEREAEAIQRRKAGEHREQIAAALGISPWTVGEYFVKARKLAGLPSIRLTTNERRSFRKALIVGKPIEEIAERRGVSVWRVRNFKNSHLTVRDRELRRIGKGRTAPPIVRRRVYMPSDVIGGRDPMYAEAWALIPSWISEDARADIASDVCLAVLERKIRRAEIPNYVQHFARQFERKFGMDRWSKVRSLDEELGDDGGMTLGDAIGDEFGVEMIEEISLGSEW